MYILKTCLPHKALPTFVWNSMKLDWCVNKHTYFVYPCSDSMPSTFEQELWKGSYRCFDTGVKSFEEVSDSTNVALLNCNMGRLMRLCAQSYASGGSMGPDAEFSTKEKHYYLKVIIILIIIKTLLNTKCLPPKS